MTAILDTSFLVAVADMTDRNHTRAVRILQSVDEDQILPVAVIPEVCYLLNSRINHFAMRRFVQSIEIGTMILETITPSDLKRISQILEKYADSRLDFVDASITAIAERLNVIRIFTLDRRDFGIIRPKHCPAFEILP